MPHDLPKAYDPTAIEDHWAGYWVKENLFSQPTPSDAERLDGKSFSGGGVSHLSALGSLDQQSRPTWDGFVALTKAITELSK